jgi:hypothetical protein
MAADDMGAVQFHFDFGSPKAYLAHLVIPKIEKRTGAKFDYVPILLGGVFKLTNNRSPAEGGSNFTLGRRCCRLCLFRHWRRRNCGPVRGSVAGQRNWPATPIGLLNCRPK